MQENQLEMLEREFPNGFLLMYCCPDRQIRFSMWNPWKDDTINQWMLQLREASENGPQSYWRNQDGT